MTQQLTLLPIQDLPETSPDDLTFDYTNID